MDVGEYLHGTVDLGEITVRNHLWWLVANTDLESSWAPVNELNGSLGLECSNCAVDVLWHNIASVEQAGSHVFAVSWITLDHLVVRLETSIRNFLDTVRFVRSLRGRNDWSVCNKREVNSWVWNQVGLELVQIDVEGAIESEGGSNGRNNYSQLSKSFIVLGIGNTYLAQ